MNNMKSRVPNKTLEHHFKFLGTRWKFLHSSLEEDYNHNCDYGKAKVFEELKRLESDTIDQKVMRQMDAQICYLLNIGSTDADWTSDQEEEEVEQEESEGMVRKERRQGSIGPASSTVAAVGSNCSSSTTTAGHDHSHGQSTKEKFNFRRTEYEKKHVEGRTHNWSGAADTGPATTNKNTAAVIIDTSDCSDFDVGIGINGNRHSNKFGLGSDSTPGSARHSPGKSSKLQVISATNSNINGSPTRRLKNQRNPDPTPESPLKISTIIPPRVITTFVSPRSSAGSTSSSNNKNISNNNVDNKSHATAGPATTTSVSNSSHGSTTAPVPALGVSVVDEESSFVGGNVSVGLSEGSSFLDGGMSSSSYLTEYDADYLLESIRNIKMFYSNKQVDQIHTTAPNTDISYAYNNNSGTGTNINNKGYVSAPLPIPLPPTSVKSSKIMSGINPKMSHYSTISPRGEGTFEHAARQKQQQQQHGQGQHQSNNYAHASRFSPNSNMGGGANRVAGSMVNSRLNSPRSGGIGSGHTTAHNVLASSPIKSRHGTSGISSKKVYSTINPESTPKLYFVANPPTSSALFSYEIPENRTDEENQSVHKLQHVQDVLAPLDIGRSFKKYAQENGLRIPTCVEKESDHNNNATATSSNSNSNSKSNNHANSNNNTNNNSNNRSNKSRNAVGGGVTNDSAGNSGAIARNGHKRHSSNSGGASGGR